MDLQGVVHQRKIGYVISDDGMLAVVVNQCESESTRRIYAYCLVSMTEQLGQLGFMAIFGMVVDHDTQMDVLTCVMRPTLMSSWSVSTNHLGALRVLVKGKVSEMCEMYCSKGERVVRGNKRSFPDVLSVGTRIVNMFAVTDPDKQPV